MRRIFTEYLRSLDPRGEPPAPEAFDELWEALRTALASELRKRGLWDSPPSFLGVYGWPSWSAPGSALRAHPHRRDDALEELLAECYVFIFVTRLESLKAHLKVKSNIDGLVFLNLRNFLHDRQQQHDPLGARVFEMLQSGVRRAVAAGELHVLAGDSKIKNDTVLGFTPDSEPTAGLATGLYPLVEGWNDDLLPLLVTARGKAKEGVLTKLRRHFPELHAAGARSFRLKDVIDPLKNDVRRRWAARLERSEGETGLEDSDDEFASVVRLAHPDTRIEERESFRKLADCVTASLEGLEVNEKTRAYLWTLWQYLGTYAADPDDAACHNLRPAGAVVVGRAFGATVAQAHELPSRRKLATLLGIPRDRLAGLYAILGELIRECRTIHAPVRSIARRRR